MLDIVQILRYRFLFFAENARREVLQSPPLCLPASLIAPPKVFTSLPCHSLGNADRRISVPRAESRQNPWFLTLADRRLDPKGLLSPYMYAARGDPAPLGAVAERKVSERSGEDAVVAFAVVWNFPRYQVKRP